MNNKYIDESNEYGLADTFLEDLENAIVKAFKTYGTHCPLALSSNIMAELKPIIGAAIHNHE